MLNEALVFSSVFDGSFSELFSPVNTLWVSQVADDGGVEPGKETSLRRNKGSEFSCMIKEAKVIASTLGILCLDG